MTTDQYTKSGMCKLKATHLYHSFSTFLEGGELSQTYLPKNFWGDEGSAIDLAYVSGMHLENMIF